MHGGKRPGAGRKLGVLSQKTLNRLKIAEEAALEGITPLELQLRYMRELWNEGTQESKSAAQKVANDVCGFVHPRLSTIDQTTTLRGDTLSQLMQAIDGRTTGIATGVEDETEPTLQ
jgi:hypothetical protein